ncbi:MAG TPA: LysR substrate-binding domain-containing protein, partial [Burkholderiaceae bacterium]|nr:LysR substrate-binding domain-containing protein [Burkholderiaceae bacterium]
RMSAFQRRRPDADIRLTTSLAPVNFKENAYDVAIRGANEPLAHCISEPFMTELIVAVCHSDFVESGRIRSPAQLADHTLISYATEPYGWSDWLRAAGQSNLRPAATLAFEQMYFALQAAAEGLGVVLVPLFLVIDDIIAGRLAAPFGLLAAKQRRYFAHAARRGPVIDAFFDWLLVTGHETEQSIAQWARAAGWADERSGPDPDAAGQRTRRRRQSAERSGGETAAGRRSQLVGVRSPTDS